MLKHLYISNFVIIDEIGLEFPKDFSAITGETGAGKSILLDALSLILGSRADMQVQRDKQKKVIVEGIFYQKNNPSIESWLQKNDIDISNEIIVRREINHNGKSRAFINDTPVSLHQIKEFSRQLIDVHQQFDTQEIGSISFQREVLDAIAGCTDETAAYHLQFQQYRNRLQEIQQLKDELDAMKASSSYKQFLLEELNEANLQLGEDEQLEKEWRLMKDAESLHALFQEGIQVLNEGNPPLLNNLKKISTRLISFGQHHEQIKALGERLQATRIELDDIVASLEKLKDLTDFNESKKEKVLQRLELIYRLQKKHQVNHLEGLMKIEEALTQFDQQLQEKEAALETLEKTKTDFRNKLELLANKLHQKRSTAAPKMQVEINEMLLRIGMPHARIKIKVENAELDAYGNDFIEFLFNANVPTHLTEKEIHFDALEKVASGGELSRLMLCIQSLVASKMKLPTLIFDEIDTGISGEAAIQVSKLLTEIARHHQVIAITHLPQIAAKANAHYYVSKKESNGQIHADIKVLYHESERIDILAVMLGGKEATEASRITARELMQH